MIHSDSPQPIDHVWQQQLAELAGAMGLVESGQARSVSVSGVDFAGLPAQVREEALARGLRLDLELLPLGGWSAKIRSGTSADNEEQPELPAQPTPVESTIRTVLPRTVLLVEDDPTLADYIKRYLGAHGIAVTVAVTERGAEAILASVTPGLLLLDINLPDAVGWSLLDSPAYLAAGRPTTIIVSAISIRPGRLRELGISGYLPKPFAMSTLLEVVERNLAKDGIQPDGEGIF